MGCFRLWQIRHVGWGKNTWYLQELISSWYLLITIHTKHINALDFDDKSGNWSFSFGNVGIIFNGASAQLFFRPKVLGNSAGSEVTHRPTTAEINRCRVHFFNPFKTLKMFLTCFNVQTYWTPYGIKNVACMSPNVFIWHYVSKRWRTCCNPEVRESIVSGHTGYVVNVWVNKLRNLCVKYSVTKRIDGCVQY